MSAIDTEVYHRRMGLAVIHETHCWPSTGRIIVINKEAYYPTPTVTALDITPGENYASALLDSTELFALKLAEPSESSAGHAMELFVHETDGRITQVDVRNLARQVVHIPTCTQCRPAHIGDDGLCQRHGKRVSS